MVRALLLVLGLGVLLVAGASHWRYDVTATMAVGDRQLMAAAFAHRDHIQEPCTACHHEFLDDSGPGQCFDCHARHPQTAALVATQFHELCRGCHLERQTAGQDAGPVRRCRDCHHAEEEP
ncbi:MAG: cytochrome c3 family protein [Pseudomonadota bacterium]